MKAMHEPGPWKWSFDCVNSLVVTDSGDFTVCQIISNTDNSVPEELQANAKLIAAAPELLEALIPFSELKGRSVLELNDMMAKAKAAIKKATGE